ncbi:MAG: carboxylating nicotinate-nucleotide diphosphorylase [Phycisphaeraceae bacterium]
MTPPPPTPRLRLHDYVGEEHLRALLQLALAEDLGPARRDVTSELVVDADERAAVRVVAREAGVISGLSAVSALLNVFDLDVRVVSGAEDGAVIAAGQSVLSLSGNLRALLAVERTLLNLLSRMSGIATETSRLTRLIQGTQAVLCDTRKTLPGWRGLDKYAVACGGGVSHRMGLYDAVLVKDNHLASIPDDELESRLKSWITFAKDGSSKLEFFEVEIDRLEQLSAMLAAGVDIVLLDNMPHEVMRQAVAERDRLAPGVLLEASGGITEKTLRAVAETGVDRISMGALTHSVRGLDLGLDRDE